MNSLDRMTRLETGSQRNSVVTYTYVRYFGEDQIEPLYAALNEVRDDWDKRCMHVSVGTRDEGDDRLQLAYLVLKRLTDRVPE